MTLQEYPVKGIRRNLLDVDLPGEALHIHMSEVGPES